MYKEIIRKGARRLGFDITKYRPGSNLEIGLASGKTLFRTLLDELSICVEPLRIVQVGANDGCTADPIYEFAKANMTRTQIILIEPQEDLIPVLRANYDWHPRAHILNAAVGRNETLLFYRLKPAYSKYFLRPDGVPRLTSGWTSSEKAHVLSLIRKFADKELLAQKGLNELVEEWKVICSPLLELLSNAELTTDYEVLQVDAEGMDDVVIYNSSVDLSRPVLVNFECHALGIGRYERLRNYLHGLGYLVIQYKSSDAVAVRVL